MRAGLHTGGLVALLLACACTTGGTPSDAGGPVDAGDDDECSPNLPPPSDPCLAGQCGNAFGVGQPCTTGGNECADMGVGNAIFCTADYDDGDLQFCTKPCVLDSQCGEGAYCGIDPADPGRGAGCIPLSCKDDETDGGVGDAGEVDAGTNDGGVDAG
jgi:hypothetical protein